MKLVFILVLLVIVSYSSDNNVNLVSLSYTKCLIEIQYAQNSTNNFTMVNCYDFKSNPPLITTLWNQCTSSCCDPRNSYAQVQETLNNCDSDSLSYYHTTFGYIFPLFTLYLIMATGTVVIIASITRKIIEEWRKRRELNAPV
jgi:hypothetical protein